MSTILENLKIPPNLKIFLKWAGVIFTSIIVGYILFRITKPSETAEVHISNFSANVKDSLFEFILINDRNVAKDVEITLLEQTDGQKKEIFRKNVQHALQKTPPPFEFTLRIPFSEFKGKGVHKVTGILNCQNCEFKDSISTELFIEYPLGNTIPNPINVHHDTIVQTTKKTVESNNIDDIIGKWSFVSMGQPFPLTISKIGAESYQVNVTSFGITHTGQSSYVKNDLVDFLVSRNVSNCVSTQKWTIRTKEKDRIYLTVEVLPNSCDQKETKYGYQLERFDVNNDNAQEDKIVPNILGKWYSRSYDGKEVWDINSSKPNGNLEVSLTRLGNNRTFGSAIYVGKGVFKVEISVVDDGKSAILHYTWNVKGHNPKLMYSNFLVGPSDINGTPKGTTHLDTLAKKYP